MNARAALTAALKALADHGRRTPCQGPRHDAWTSEDLDERRRAAALCRRCPVLALCASAAAEQQEQWHVWAGRDFTGERAERVNQRQRDRRATNRPKENIA